MSMKARKLTAPRHRGLKAMLAAVVAAGAVAWQIIACVESPMSFSPTGDLAFTVMDPYEGNEDFHRVTDRAYRLMVLSKDRELREVERSFTHMLTAPAYSPDGSEFAYLRLPLLTPDEAQRMKKFIEERKKQEEAYQEGSDPGFQIGTAPEESDDAFNHDFFDAEGNTASGRRFMHSVLETMALMRGGPQLRAKLIIRTAATGEKITSVPVGLQFLGNFDYLWTYLLTRPEYSPDGQRILVTANRYVLTISPATSDTRLFAVGAKASALSPDGNMLAALIDSFDTSNNKTALLALIDMDGERAVHVRLRNDPSLSGLTWIGNDMLALLKDGGGALDVYDADGHFVHSVPIPAVEHSGDESDGELAVSPDGGYMAVSFRSVVHFLSADGQPLGTWQADEESDEFLVQPVFTPDSRQVAFKLVTVEEGEDEWPGTTAIVFFSPEGQVLFRVPIPRIPEDERPAPPAPATEETPQ
jgi:hypothetical protein